MTGLQVYLDHNASAPLLGEARDAMIDVMALTGNPSSVHMHGRALANVVEKARKQVADVARAQQDQVVFTGSATEAITQAIVGGARHFKIDRVIVSAGEHAAVLSAAEISGANVQVVGLLPDGTIDVNQLENMLQQADATGEKALVAVHMVNNESGVVQPTSRIEALVGPTPHLLFVDAVQGFAKLPIEFASSAIDMMAITAHKIGGPAGVGALLMMSHCDAVRLIPGGGQEQGRRGGTQATILIAGFGAAAEAYGKHYDLQQLTELVVSFEQQMRDLCPDLMIFGGEAKRIGSVSNFALPGIQNPVLMMGLDLAGISVSAGSACSSGKVGRSHVLDAMGVASDLVGCAIRISVGWTTEKTDVEQAITAISEIYHRQVGRNGQAA